MGSVALVFLFTLGACAPAISPPPSASPGLPRDIEWVRNAAEYRAVTTELYRLAEERIRAEAAGRAPGSWAVVLDGDETVLDNGEYQQRLAETGTSFRSETWYAWAREEAAGAVPGARGFLQIVHSLGGRIAIVTNRDDAICEPTRNNLRRLDIPFDVVLCRVDGESEKEPRFEAVANGTAAPAMGPAEVLLWVGDNIEDFPGLTQESVLGSPAGLEPFGARHIVLPNPMYGSWE